MQISLMTYDGYPNTINKQTSVVKNLTGSFRSDYNFMNPVVDLDGLDIQNLFTAGGVNYILIDGKYYFINDWVIKENGMVQATLHLDVLKTYQSDIMDMKVVTKKTSNITSDITDRQLPVKDRKLFNIVDFPKEFDETETNGTYIMVTAQTGYSPV